MIKKIFFLQFAMTSLSYASNLISTCDNEVSRTKPIIQSDISAETFFENAAMPNGRFPEGLLKEYWDQVGNKPRLPESELMLHKSCIN